MTKISVAAFPSFLTGIVFAGGKARSPFCTKSFSDIRLIFFLNLAYCPSDPSPGGRVAAYELH